MLVLACVQDVRCGRIGNRLCLAGWGIGLVTGLVRYGTEGLRFWLEGAGTGFLWAFLFYLCGVTGAGDVKLLSVVSGVFGREAVQCLMIGTLLFGGVFSVFCLVCRLRAGRSERDPAGGFRKSGLCKARTRKGGRAVLVIPLSPAILGAAMVWLLKGG